MPRAIPARARGMPFGFFDGEGEADQKHRQHQTFSTMTPSSTAIIIDAQGKEAGCDIEHDNLKAQNPHLIAPNRIDGEEQESEQRADAHYQIVNFVAEREIHNHVKGSGQANRHQKHQDKQNDAMPFTKAVARTNLFIRH